MLQIPDDTLISFEEALDLDDDQVVILVTGRMGEPTKSLQQIANGDDPDIQLTSTDLVFVTTTPSYAIETMVQKTKDMLYRAGAEVKFIADDLNPSGQASQNDEQLMLNFMKPKFFIPIKGNTGCLTGTPNWLKKSASRPKTSSLPLRGTFSPMKMASSTWGTGLKLATR